MSDIFKATTINGVNLRAAMSDEKYKCPYCGNHSVLTEKTSEVFEVKSLLKDSLPKELLIVVCQQVCAYSECNKSSFVILGFHSATYSYGSYGNSRVQSCGERFFRFDYPEVIPSMIPDFVPKSIKDDYVESFKIKHLSPKASATLARRCLQGMIRDFWGVTGQPSLAKEIVAIEDKVDPTTWSAIDAVRKIGNIGAHMEKDINVIIDVDEGEAELLLSLIEDLVKDWYVTRDERRKRSEALIAAAKIKKSPPVSTSGDGKIEQ